MNLPVGSKKLCHQKKQEHYISNRKIGEDIDRDGSEKIGKTTFGLPGFNKTLASVSNSGSRLFTDQKILKKRSNEPNKRTEYHQHT